jgi:hypothetical protein
MGSVVGVSADVTRTEAAGSSRRRRKFVCYSASRRAVSGAIASSKAALAEARTSRLHRRQQRNGHAKRTGEAPLGYA